jgi:hypothetical protein
MSLITPASDIHWQVPLSRKKKEAQRASHHEFISATGPCGKAGRVK